MEGYTIYFEEYMKAITESKWPIVEDQRGFVDESGCRRYTMTYDELQSMYKQMEKFCCRLHATGIPRKQGIDNWCFYPITQTYQR